ncbi:MAG: histone deacetylase [Spirochaetaceae bacterium]
MILHEAASRPAVAEYGISIPIYPSSVARTLEHLLADPFLGPRKDEWLFPAPDSPVSRELLELVHDPAYLDRLLGDGGEEEVIRTYELVDSRGHYHRYDPRHGNRSLREMVTFALITAAGSLACAEAAVREGSCFFLGGGMHHGKREGGDGFCLVNDPVIAARGVQSKGVAGTVWIIDLDVHKGDGTAALTEGDPTIRTLSIHMARGWPLDRPERLPDGSRHPSHIPSDLDIPIDRNEEDAYLPLLADGLESFADQGGADLAIVLYGADPYERDELPSSGGIKLTLPQMMERDQLVYRFLRDRGIPRAYLKAGGYGNRAWEPLTQFLSWYLREELAPG